MTRDACLAQAKINCIMGKAKVMFLAGKALLLGRGNDLAVPHQAGRTVMIERGNAKDAHTIRDSDCNSTLRALGGEELIQVLRGLLGMCGIVRTFRRALPILLASPVIRVKESRICNCEPSNPEPVCARHRQT